MDPSTEAIPIMENQMENIENELETVVMSGFLRGPSIQRIPTLGLKVGKHYLYWAIWIPRGVASLAKKY